MARPLWDGAAGHLQRMRRIVNLVFFSAQLFQSILKLTFGGQGNGAGGAASQADLAAGEAAERVGHERLAGFGVPLKNVVRTEIKALQVPAAGTRVNRGKPRNFLAKIAQQGHFSSLPFTRHMNNRTGYSPPALNGAAYWDQQALAAAREFGPEFHHWLCCGRPMAQNVCRRTPCCARLS